MGKPINPKSLRVRLLALVLLALIPSVFLMILSAQERRKQDAFKVQEEAMRLVLFTASNLERDVLAARAFLTGISQDLRRPKLASEACGEEMRSFLENLGYFSLVGVADSTGKVLCGSAALETSTVSAVPWFGEAMHSNGFTVGYDGDRILSRKVTMDFALPMRTAEGRTLIAFCALDLDWLNALAVRVQLPPNSTLTVLGSRDQVLVRYPDPQKWVGSRLPEDPLAASTSLNKEGVTEAPGLDGVRRLYAFTEIPSGRLSLRLGIPTALAYAGADRAMRHNLIWLGLGAFLALLATWIAGNVMVVRPVNKLVEATRRLATGDLSTRVDLDYRDGELGQLAKAFDEMAENLEWREAQLRESEQERVQSEGRFTEMVEMAADAIIGVDAGYHISFFNRGAERIFGYRSEEVEGRDIRILEGGENPPRHGQDDPLTAGSLLAALQEPGHDRLIAILRTKDGTPFPAEATLSRANRNGQSSVTLIVRKRKEAGVNPEGQA